MSLLSFIQAGNIEAIKAAVAQDKTLLFQNIGEGTLLSHAAWSGQLEMVIFLVQEGAVLNDQANPNRQTPLMRAASYGHVKVVDYLLTRSDIEPNLQSRSGKTALKYAISGDNGDDKYFLTAKRLLDASVLIDSEDTTEPALMSAKNNRVFDLLISYKPNLEAQDGENKTLLLKLCQSSEKDSVTKIQLLNDLGVNVAHVDKNGNSALMLVDKKSKLAVAKVQRLLAAGARVDHVSNSGQTVFSDLNACPLELLDLLLNAAVTQQAKVPSTVVWFYYERKDWEKVISLVTHLLPEEREKLVDKKGYNLWACALMQKEDELSEKLAPLYNINTRLPNGNSYLNVALQNHCFVTATKLLTLGADINEKDKNDETLLMNFLNSSKNTAVVNFLLEHQADVNAISKQNNTALITCVQTHSNMKFLSRILEGNTTVNHFNAQKMTALYILVTEANDHFEYKEDYLQAIKLFLDSGADKTLRCDWRNTSIIERSSADYRRLLEHYEPTPKSPKIYQTASRVMHFQPGKENAVTPVNRIANSDLTTDQNESFHI